MFEEDHAPVNLSEISESAVACQYIELAHHRQSRFDRLFPRYRFTNISIHSLFNYSFRSAFYPDGGQSLARGGQESAILTGCA